MGTLGRYTFTIVDELGATARLRLYMDVDTSQTNDVILGDVAGLIAAIDPCIDGQIVNASFILGPLGPGGKLVPNPGARVEQNGLFDLQGQSSIAQWGLVLPSLSANIITAGRIDLGNPNITTLISLLTGSISSGHVCTPWHDATLTFRGCEIAFRSRHKSAKSTSKP